MTTKNRTIATEFILLGFSNDVKINVFLFILFLVIYLVILGGNGLITWLILICPQLHTPMYFFLCILAFLDFCISTTVVPRMLDDLITSRRFISLGACAVQFYTVLLIGGIESLLLALMAYDRYVAICRPLHYPVLMRWSICHRLTALVFTVSFMIFIVPALAMPMDLCYPNHINHFMCEVSAVTHLACDTLFLNDVVMLVTCFVALLLPFVFIIISYALIISSVMKIHSAGRSKAFSTCTSHVSVVVLFYGAGMLMYFGPTSNYTTNHGKYLSLFSYIICPSLNPIIYSLNNKDVKKRSKEIILKHILVKSTTAVGLLNLSFLFKDVHQ